MLRRASWTSLNGVWQFAIDSGGEWSLPCEVVWSREILVPYSPETAKSGVGETGLHRAFWYKRTFEAPELDRERLFLHFGAVDYEASVWVDGSLAGRHEGGYTPFAFDVTDLLDPANREHEVVVRAEDDPGDLAKPRGKQDWQLEPHSIWYPRTSGIWQTVWLERAPVTRVQYLRWTPSLERWEIAVEAHIAGAAPGARLHLTVRLRCNDVMLADDRYLVVAGEVHRRIALSDPGIDDFRNELLWSPGSPKLIEAEVRIVDADGRVLDEVASYTALRSFVVQGDRLVLNGRPYLLRMILDQGYWPESGLTAPDDEALKRDVELTKAMGFNGARKHQKIEDPRYLYWADRLGLLVWQEMPSAYRFTKRSVERLTREWLAAVRRDISHPCIVAWVPFNESWGVPNLPDSKPERHYVQALYHLTKTLDPTRPVIGNDGWESVATDIIGIHDYDDDPQRLARRYHAHEVLPRLLTRERPGGRALVIEGSGVGQAAGPIVLSEFGGIAFSSETETKVTWGYARCATAAELGRRYTALLGTVCSLEMLAGFCYTQLTDTYQEANGLLYADRRPKVPLAEIAAATRQRTGYEEPGNLAAAATARLPGVGERDGSPP
ncbi:MAG: glycoside hydrolase family 2 [Myxococcota bacterium]|nr:glycoside hydrolase family 2 [Myxococcota bacterium]